MIRNLKIGDKVILYSLEECKNQSWFIINASDHFDVCEWEGFKQIKINSIEYPMFDNLGTLVTIKYLHEYYFRIEDKEWCWPYQLIKNKNYEI